MNSSNYNYNNQHMSYPYTQRSQSYGYEYTYPRVSQYSDSYPTEVVAENDFVSEFEEPPSCYRHSLNTPIQTFSRRSLESNNSRRISTEYGNQFDSPNSTPLNSNGNKPYGTNGFFDYSGYACSPNNSSISRNLSPTQHLYEQSQYHNLVNYEDNPKQFTNNMNDRKCDIPCIKDLYSGAESRTVVMIRNIPNRYKIADLQVVFDLTAKNLYKIIYLPQDAKTTKNLGYAFIRFFTSTALADTMQARQGQTWPNSNSKKKCMFYFAQFQEKKSDSLLMTNHSLPTDVPTTHVEGQHTLSIPPVLARPTSSVSPNNKINYHSLNTTPVNNAYSYMNVNPSAQVEYYMPAKETESRYNEDSSDSSVSSHSHHSNGSYHNSMNTRITSMPAQYTYAQEQTTRYSYPVPNRISYASY